MSSGGLLQLVAYGTQDVYITGQPQVTFFRVVYRRHTNFAMESMEQTLTGSADWNRKVSCLISRNGDLIHKAYLQIDLPALTAAGTGVGNIAWTRNVGHVMIDEVSVEIGGAIIDRHYGQYLTIYQELTMPAEKAEGYSVMIGNHTGLTTPRPTIAATTLYVPLIFWFCKSPGLALPLIALLHHDVRINISFRPFHELYSQYATTGGALVPVQLATVPSLVDVKLYVDYIFCDAPERRMFAQMNHEYLIEQLQFVGSSGTSSSTVREKLSFSHPTKELIWVVQRTDNTAGMANRWVDFTDAGTSGVAYGGDNPMVDAKIQLGAHDRISTRKAGYFNLVQPFHHHTAMPSTGIYVYSFALKPEEHQPSGSINMSRIESITLNMTLNSTAACRIFPYAINYNILRLTAGEHYAGKSMQVKPVTC